MYSFYLVACNKYLLDILFVDIDMQFRTALEFRCDFTFM